MITQDVMIADKRFSNTHVGLLIFVLVGMVSRKESSKRLSTATFSMCGRSVTVRIINQKIQNTGLAN